MNMSCMMRLWIENWKHNSNLEPSKAFLLGRVKKENTLDKMKKLCWAFFF